MARKNRRRRSKPALVEVVKTRHHFRPRSRGGMDGFPNEAGIDDKALHHPYHTLFSNLRPSEVILLLLFSFETICPYMEKIEPKTKDNRRGFIARMRAWDTMFGECADWGPLLAQRTNMKLAINKMVEEFVQTKEDKKLVMRALRKGMNGNVLSSEEICALKKMMGFNIYRM